jgi:hypothetical protein
MYKSTHFHISTLYDRTGLVKIQNAFLEKHFSIVTTNSDSLYLLTLLLFSPEQACYQLTV